MRKPFCQDLQLDALAQAGLCAALSLAPGPSRFDPNMKLVNGNGSGRAERATTSRRADVCREDDARDARGRVGVISPSSARGRGGRGRVRALRDRPSLA